MTEKKTVTVAGVPGTVRVVNGELAVTAGRYDPAVAGAARHPPAAVKPRASSQGRK